MAVLLPPLQAALGALLTSELFSRPVLHAGLDGARYDLDRAEQLLAQAEQLPAVRAVRGCRRGEGGGGDQGAQIQAALDHFAGQVGADFPIRRPALLSCNV